MNAWTVILDIVLILISIVLIIAVLLQQGQRCLLYTSRKIVQFP